VVAKKRSKKEKKEKVPKVKKSAEARALDLLNANIDF
jgi:hypothetical protein